MEEYAEIEIGLQRRWSGRYDVGLRFSLPSGLTDIRATGEAAFDLVGLRALYPESTAYGEALAKGLFQGQTVREAFLQALSSAQAQELPIRLRLLIDSSAPELHDLRWEALRHPVDGSLIATNERILFSRYLTSLDWRPVKMKPKGAFRALVVVPNPANLDEYDLQAVDQEFELERAREGLGLIPVETLTDRTPEARPSLDNLADRLRQGMDGAPFDVVYVACHGALVKGEPWLFLEGENGELARIAGADLASLIQQLPERPSLVVLASCESAGDGSGEALSALGPRLTEAGIPAVLAMQGQVSQSTVAEFMPAFFENLADTGVVDQAVAVARWRVRDQDDFWMPVLFMRLRSGRIWYGPGFSGEENEADIWKSLKTFIRVGRCTAIVGPELSEPLLGSQRDIARRWAEGHDYPLYPFDRDDLPRVSQYVVTRHGLEYLSIIFNETLREALTSRFGEDFDAELRDAKQWSVEHLRTALDLAANAHASRQDLEGHRVLARLGLPVYITANIGDVLERALEAEGRLPVVRLCRWNEDIDEEKCLYEGEPDPDHPLVYHLFGHLSEPDSLVLTEDQFFDFLIGINDFKESIPRVINTRITNSALLFTGFQLEDWYFRVFFRVVRSKQGAKGRDRFYHAVSQIAPEEGRIQNAREARRYLERYFNRENISIYWGSSADFLEDLWHNLEADA